VLPCSAQDLSSTSVFSSGPSINRFDLLFVGDRYFEGDMGTYAADIDRIWNSMRADHTFWSRYQFFFNIHRVDLVSSWVNTNDIKHVDNSALGIDLNLNGPFFLTHDRNEIAAITNALSIAADSSIIIMGKGYNTGFGWFNSDLGYGAPRASLIAHELGHTLVGLRDEYWTWITSTVGVPNMAKTHAEAQSKWGYWYGYVDPMTGLSVGVLDGGVWVPHQDPGDDYYRPSPQITLMKSSTDGHFFDAVSREQLILDLYRHVRPLDAFSDTAHAVHSDQVLEAQSIDTNVISLAWCLDGLCIADTPTFDLFSLDLEEDTTVQLIAWDNTLNEDYETDDRGGYVRRDASGLLTQTISWTVMARTPTDTDGDMLPDFWEIRYQFDPLDPLDAQGNGDLDLGDNLQEFAFATDPGVVDAGHDVRIIQNANMRTIVFKRFKQSRHLSYEIQSCPTLVTPDWQPVSDATEQTLSLDHETEEVRFTIPGPVLARERYYRVAVHARP
jgi:hypothetical protein